MGRHAGLLALLALLGCLLVHANVELRGVHPSDAALYAGQTFACKDGSKTDLPLTKVNDDYCDCADGSDEPGTSACDNGSFFCPNRGHLGRKLFSSRVNDGICDCCDGSDEYDGKAKCQDTCYALGEGTRIAKRKEIEAFKKGLEIRRHYETQAKTVRVEKQNKLDKLKTELAQSQQMEKDLQAQVDALETKAKAAQELLAQYKPAEVPVQPPIEQEQFHEEDGDDHLLEEEEEADEDEDEDEDGEENEDGDNGGNLREETEETKKEPRILLERTDDVKEALEQAEQDVAEYKASKKHRDEGEEEGILASVWRFLGSSGSSSPPSGEATMSDLKDLRTSLKNVQSKAQETAKDISDLEGYFGIDLGEDAFYGIHEQTFELHTNEYTYKLTPFKEVKQQHTRLGEWGSWLNPEHTQMEYVRGERCWNGPDRKTVVNLTCGDANNVVSVSEPNKCEYHMEFTTPAACSPQRLAQLEEELASLEQPGDVIIPPTNDIF
jgi:protein kinase C substrate 80K-H